MNNSVPASRYWAYFLLSSVALLWDLGTKWWVFRTLGFPFHTSDWSWSTRLLWGKLTVGLTTSFNRGALWGVGQGYSWVFAVLSVLAVAFVVYWLFVRGEAQSWWFTISFALITGGALGNLYDRLHLHGCEIDGNPIYGVRDFIDCKIPLIGFDGPFSLRLIPEYDWPIFNFADTYLVTGAILLTVLSFLAPVPESTAASERVASSAS